jgi:hypothetical protein
MSRERPTCRAEFGPTPKSERAMQAMMQMKTPDIAKLGHAYRG